MNLIRRVASKSKAKSAARDGNATYDSDKKLLTHPDMKVRKKLATRTDVKREILYYLASDSSPDVRREIARNTVTPVQADLLLVRDTDEAVRVLLADKLARLLPGLAKDAQDQVRERVVEMVETLARDSAARVRQMLSDALKDVADAPPQVIKRLARDAELEVARPVLRFSPLLTDQDLLDIIAGGPVAGALVAIAERDNVSAAVSDAIVGTEEEPAVAALLGNPSAQIREETLDLIVERAPAHPSWHGPLVDRPKLPSRAARRIASFVAEALLKKLHKRKDLDADAKAAVSAEVRRRLDDDADDDADDDGESPEAMAKRMMDAGELDEDTIAFALSEGKAGFVMAALALKSGIKPEIVSKIMSARSPKGVTALAWKAGMGPRFSGQLQMRLGGIAPKQVLPARNGEWPMSPEDMTWHLEFFGA
jgi:uncharacterized protein (DUF2336 family)